jgi:TonB family protein
MTLPSLFACSVRALALAGVGGLLILCMRRRPAAFEHAIWTFVAAGMLCLPLLQQFVPPTPVHFFSEPRMLQPPSWDEIIAARAPVVHLNDPAIVIKYGYRWTWRTIVWFAWFSGLLVLAGRIVLGHMLARRALALARSVRGEPGIRPLLRSGVELKTAIEECPAVSSPFTFGIWSMRIVLPLCWREWPEAKLRAVLAHEFGHVERRDTLAGLAAALNTAVFWFHPVAWWIRSRIAALAEHAADDAVLSSSIVPADYASVLLQIAAAKGTRSLLWQAAPMSGNSIAARIDRILEPRIQRLVTLPLRVRGVMGLAALAASVIAASITFPSQAIAQRKPAPNTNPPFFVMHHSEMPGPALSEADVSALQLKLAANPDDEGTRKSLLVYYWEHHTAEPRVPLIFWLIQHHPESELLSSIVTTFGPNPPKVNIDTEAALWRAQLQAHPNDVAVLLNAGRAFIEIDRLEQIRLAERAVGLDATLKPALAFLYALDLVNVDRVPGFKNSDVMNHIKSTLISSNDPAVLGNTGLELVKQVLRERAPNFDYAGFRSFAMDLLARAEGLDPSNPEWVNAMEGAKRLPLGPPAAVVSSGSGNSSKMIRVGGEVQRANLFSAPQPAYPESAKQQQIQGTVELDVRIDETGHVADARVISGPEALSDAALKAVKQYVYKPTMLNGKPVIVLTTVKVGFAL